MRKISALLAIIVLLGFTGCAKAQEQKQPTAPPISSEQIGRNVQKEIDKLQGPLNEAKMKLEAKPEWQEYLRQRQTYNDAAELFNKQSKEIIKLPEFKALNAIERQVNYLKRLTEGGK